MKLITYVKETRAEMMHVNWPTRKQTIIYTTIVVVLSLVVAVFLGAFDTFFTYLLDTFVI